jgi:hypothetical protein
MEGGGGMEQDSSLPLWGEGAGQSLLDLSRRVTPACNTHPQGEGES